jgi:ATP adenylyltransferase
MPILQLLLDLAFPTKYRVSCVISNFWESTADFFSLTLLSARLIFKFYGVKMEKLWAPWRMKYIEKDDSGEGCFLCRALKSSDDKESLVLARRECAFLIMNRFPYSNAHLMAVPNRHIGEFEGLSPDEILATMSLVQESVAVLKRAIGAQGFNIGINIGRVAGAGLIDHAHIHIVPRWSGDTNFMPVLADTKVVNEHLIATFDKLVPYFKR